MARGRSSARGKGPRARRSPARRPAAPTAKRKTGSRAAARRKGPSARTRLARRVGHHLFRVGIVGVLLFAGISATLFYYGRNLPSVDGLETARLQPRITVLDRNGEVIGVHGQDRGDPIRSEDLPPHVIQALIATEDRTFFHHVGVNPIAILRALTVNLKAGGVAQGGSTITQQLVKNLVLSPEQTIERKVQEMLLALKIEATYDKDEILSLYLNAVYFGNGAYGLEAAARRYFGKSPQELDIGEAAMLAGLLKAPSKYAPTHSEDAAKARAQIVLQAMVEAGFLKRSQAAEIIAAGIADPVEADLSLAYAVDHAVAMAQRLVGPAGRDLFVETTIDGEATRATAAARARIAAQDRLYGPSVQTAALALDADGAIRILIGGNDYRQSVYNRATQAVRQPGSVFKTFVFLTALEEGWRPEDMIDDSPIVIGDYTPQNYKDVYAGEVSLTEAFRRSLNAAALRLQEEIGRPRIVRTAKAMGLDAATDVGPSLALGTLEATPLEVAESFLPFANHGYRATPYIVTQVRDAQGRVLFRHEPPAPAAPVLAEDVRIAFDHMMRAVVREGSGGNAAILPHHAAGKTGTSQDSRDAWFAGYASGMVGVVWLGKDDNTPMEWGGGAYVSGSGAPSRVWAAMMTAALQDKPVLEPLPYVPAPKVEPLTLFEHLAAILRGERREGPAVSDDPGTADPAPLPPVIDRSRAEVAVPAQDDGGPKTMEALLTAVTSGQEPGSATP